MWNTDQYTPQIISGRMVIFDRAGNVAAYEDERGTLVPGPAAIIPNPLNGYTPEQIARMGRGQASGLGLLGNYQMPAQGLLGGVIDPRIGVSRSGPGGLLGGGV